MWERTTQAAAGSKDGGKREKKGAKEHEETRRGKVKVKMRRDCGSGNEKVNKRPNSHTSSHSQPGHGNPLSSITTAVELAYRLLSHVNPP